MLQLQRTASINPGREAATWRLLAFPVWVIAATLLLLCCFNGMRAWPEHLDGNRRAVSAATVVSDAATIGDLSAPPTEGEPTVTCMARLLMLQGIVAML